MFNNNKGFTLIELLVVMSIVLLLSGFVLVDFKGGGDSLSLERSAETIAQNIRKASVLAMSGQEFDDKIQKGGYGIYLEVANPNQYILYGNKNPNSKIFTASSNEINTINLEKGVKIKEIKVDGSTESDTSINFKAPDPIVSISENKDEAIIILCLEEGGVCLIGDEEKTAAIKVYKTGAVEIK